MLIEGFMPSAGASLMFGAPKSNKTLLAVQAGIAVASGHPFCDQYRVIEPGPVLMIEQDDPAGAASVKGILQCSPVPVAGIDFSLAPRVPFSFGLQFIEWLESEIRSRSLRLVILDSYTALRGSRTSGIDIVKAEQTDLTLLDDLAKRTGCAILIIHHDSKGSAGLDWSSRAAGTFAMGAATEAEIHVSRFGDLDSNAPERLVRLRGRHLEGLEMVLRFRKDTLDHEHVLEGGAAPFFPWCSSSKRSSARRYSDRRICPSRRASAGRRQTGRSTGFTELEPSRSGGSANTLWQRCSEIRELHEDRAPT
jgi:AAA domain